MKSQLYPARNRGTADLGWLKANFSFSFGNYFDPARVQFGMLRVLNDDTIAAGMGFGTHPHENMEIITIPLEGGLQHRDSMGNAGVIRFGEVQVMSAGTGIQHSEMNASATEQAKTLQLWVFPEIEQVSPRYEQRSFDPAKNRNAFVTIVSPHDKQDGQSLWVYQQTYFHLGVFDAEQSVHYEVRIPGNGVYVFLLDGSISIDGHDLGARDAIGLTETEAFAIRTHEPSRILLVEVPMKHK